MAAIYRDLAADDARNRQITEDVIDAIHRGRYCLVLTQWIGHLERLAAALRELVLLRTGRADSPQ